MTKEQLYADYAGYHRDTRNRRAHAVGIPFIVFGLLGFFSLVRIGPIDLAVVAAVVVLLYYAVIDAFGALLCAFVFAILYVLAVRVPWEVSLAAFVCGWGFQLVGHRLEGNKPKFLENAVYLLIGPLYFFRELAGILVPSRRVN